MDTPHYLLFGRSGEAFLVHLISAPPDFQQVLKVEFVQDANAPDIAPEQLDAALAQGLFLSLPERTNTEGERLRPGETLACSAGPGTELPLTAAGLRIVEEIYCEAGELSELVISQVNALRPCS